MHVYVAINEERDYQDKKHADDKHSVSEWLTIMGSYANKANEAFAKGGDKCLETMLDCMRKITASGVACMEQNGIVSRYLLSPEPVCDVCGDTEEQHKPDADHAFIGAVFEWPPEPGKPGKPKIDAMVDAFLAWPLPESVRSDLCATMTPKEYPHPRSGTNLLTAVEAKQMFEYVLAKVQESETMRRADLIKKLNEEFTPVGDAALSKLKAQAPSQQITDPVRLAELRKMNDYTGQSERCDACGSPKRARGLCCIVCGKPDEPIMLSDFRKDIERTINRYSKENGSNTPDFILAQYLEDCLGAFGKAVMAREKAYGRVPKPAPPDVVGKPFLSSI
jgi:hypothetical protein